jgi:hypothetical protein
MGFLRVINPDIPDSLEIPYIGLHYMEHGSFSYYGDLHVGRVNPVKLKELLEHASGVDGHTSNTHPRKFHLYQNHPNPFNPVTTIAYSIQKPEHVRLVLFDIRGRLIGTLIDKKQQAGKHFVKWKAERLPSGIYFCRIHAGSSYTKTIKMVLVR